MTEAKSANPLQIVQQQFAAREHEFAKALPAHMRDSGGTQRFIRIVMTAIQTDLANPYSKGELLRADRASLFRACLQCAQDGLLPDGREAVLVAYNVKDIGPQAQYQPMVAGIRKKVRQSGEIASWEARLVYASDIFKIVGGDDEKIIHEIDFEGGREDRNIRAVYSIAHFKDGAISRDWMAIAEVNRIRSRARTQKVWNSDYGEMVKKTMIKRHAKALPLSAELDRLIQRDDDAYDLQSEPRYVGGRPAVTLAPSSRIDSANPETWRDGPQQIEPAAAGLGRPSPDVRLATAYINAQEPEAFEASKIEAPKPRRGRPRLSELGKQERQTIEHQASAPSEQSQVPHTENGAEEASAETGSSVPADALNGQSYHFQSGYNAYENGAPLRPLPMGYRGHDKKDMALEWMSGWQAAQRDNVQGDDEMTEGAE